MLLHAGSQVQAHPNRVRPWAAALQAHTDMHMHVSPPREHAHAHTGALVSRRGSARTHSTCRQLLASTRAAQRSHTNRARTRLPAHPCLAVCRREPGALNFPTVEPLEEPKAAPGRGLARGPQSLPCEGSPLRSQSLSEFGGSGRIAATRSRSGAAPRDRHCHLAVRTSPGGGCSPPQVPAGLDPREAPQQRLNSNVCG